MMHDNSLGMWDRYYASDSGSWFFAKMIHWGREAYFGKLFARRVQSLGGSASSYLELGVGTAQTLTRLQKMTGIPCTGIEITPRAYEIGKLTAPNCTLVLGDALALPFEDQSFDVIYSLGLFEHFEPDQQRTLLSEQARVSKKMILVEVPTRSPHMRSIMWFNRVVRKRKGVWADDELFSRAHFKEKFPGLPFRYYFDWGSGAMTCWFILRAEDVRAYLKES